MKRSDKQEYFSRIENQAELHNIQGGSDIPPLNYLFDMWMMELSIWYEKQKAKYIKVTH